MTDLKTLKDLPIRRPIGMELAKVDYLKQEFRNEIIKHIKAIDKTIYHDSTDNIRCPHCDYSFNDKANSDKVAQIFILKYIFNITKTDLKE